MTAATPERKRLYARLHMLKASAGLADGEYRARLVELTGKDSVTKMDDVELEAAVQSFDRAARAAKNSRRRADTPHARKARALWVSLYHLGEVDDPAERALAKFVERQHGVSDLRFLPGREAAPVIEGLKAWCERAGVQWGLWQHLDPEVRDRFAVVGAQWTLLKLAAAAPALDLAVYTRAAIGRPSPALCDAGELDLLIIQLGKRIRSLRGTA